jgi:hypothetical protein
MINFRFHLVSLIAVFLALGLGILVGSTFVDQVIVDRLDREISGARRDTNAANAQNAQLKDSLAQTDDFLARSAAYTVEGRLQSVPVAVVAERGVDAGAVKALLATLRDAGADAPGVFWLNEAWRLDTQEGVGALRDAAGVSGADGTVRADALRILADRLAEPRTDGRRSTDVIEELRAAGFVDFGEGDRARLPRFPARAARVVVLTGTDGRLATTDTVVRLVQAFAAANVPTVVGEVYDDHDGVAPVPQRGAALAPVRGDADLAQRVSTYDNAELVSGHVTAVIALEQRATGAVGHYGFGEGASAALPARSS